MNIVFDLESDALKDHVPALLEKDCHAGNRLVDARMVMPSTESFTQSQIELGTFMVGQSATTMLEVNTYTALPTSSKELACT